MIVPAKEVQLVAIWNDFGADASTQEKDMTSQQGRKADDWSANYKKINREYR